MSTPTQPTLSAEELLTRIGKAYRASLPQYTPEEKARRNRELWERLAEKIHARLDANDALACCLCETERPRTDEDHPRPDDHASYYYPSRECVNVRQPWHYHRDWTRGANQKKKQRETRRHRRRLRKGRLPCAPTPDPA